MAIRGSHFRVDYETSISTGYGITTNNVRSTDFHGVTVVLKPRGNGMWNILTSYPSNPKI